VDPVDKRAINTPLRGETAALLAERPWSLSSVGEISPLVGVIGQFACETSPRTWTKSSIHDELDLLRKTVAAQGTLNPAAVSAPQAGPMPTAQFGARERILEALQEGEHDWIGIESLATLAGVSETQAMDLLRAEPRVILGMGKSGRPIAGIKERVRR
jgi:hypothetical protein